MSRRTTVTVDVEVTLDNIDAEKLIAELEGRGYTIAKAGEAIDPALESGVNAYLCGRAEALRDWARSFLQDRAFRCLP
jgi:hypothetical protein